MSGEPDDPQRADEENSVRVDSPPAEPPPAAQRKGPHTLHQIFNYGVSDGSAGSSPRENYRPAAPPSDTGKLTTAEVVRITSSYFCSPTFKENRSLLHPGHVLILQGEPGSGRRAAGVAFLSRLPGLSEFVVLSPALDLNQLATRRWSANTAYLLVDHQVDYGAQTDEVTWRRITSALDDCKSALVVTTSAKSVSRMSLQAVHVVYWQQPDPIDVLTSLTEDLDQPEGWHDLLVGKLPGRLTMSELESVASALTSGESVDHALRVFSDSLHEKLDLWFAEKKTLRDLVEITAASLLGPQFRREFEHNVATLEQILVPPREDSGDTPDGDGPMLDLGRRRFTDADLLCQRTEVAHRSVEQVIDFREDGLRSATLMRLWEAQNSTFWDAIHTWVAGMVSEQLSPEVAYALSVIARCSSLEVEATYLVPWASGAFGLDAQATVVLTLWHMSEDDATAPVALQIAVAWTNGRSMGERQCAMIAFSGDLGVRFPGEAVRRLWQGISQSPSVREEASISLSTLFTRLVEHKREASIVLKLIHTQLSRRQSSAVRFREVRTATLDVAYKLVSATLPNNRLACFELLHDDKSSVSMVAEIFGFLVQNRPARRSTLIQLRQGLLDLAAMGEAAVELARAFGTALLSAVDATGAAALKREFLTIDRLERRGTDSSSAETISACFESFVVGEIADGSILQ